MAEAVAELHGSEPVEFEVAVEVAASANPLEGEGAGGPMSCAQQPQEELDPKLPHNQLAISKVCSSPFVESSRVGRLESMMLVARVSCRH